MRRIKLLILVLLLAVPAAFAGYAWRRGESAKPAVVLYPVEGKLIVSERPGGKAHVVFHPVEPSDSMPRSAVAFTKPDGTFRLMTFAPDDGAPAGDYVVTVVWPNEAYPADECEGIDLLVHDRLGGLFANPATSSLRATVRPERNEITIRAVAGGRSWNLPRLKDAVKTDARPPADERDRDR